MDTGYVPFQPPTFPCRRYPEQANAASAHHPIIIVGGGLVGLSLAIDLAQKGHHPIVLEGGDTVSQGSRSICQAKRSLEIWDRLGVGEEIRDKGVTWNVGRVFHGDEELYAFDLLPEDGHKMPAFVNLQQYHVELALLRRLDQLGVDVRWRHAATAVTNSEAGAVVDISTPDGDYSLNCDWLIACDGAKSLVRRCLGLIFDGKAFEDKFLITDVYMKSNFPAERWFWFDPPFHKGQTALLHRQANDIWRIDLQLGNDADAELEKSPARVRKRIEAMLGHGDFELDWVSVYNFQCRTLEKYVHGRVIFAGDAAHQVSPFGARGGNGGIQDIDNLAWKLSLVVTGAAPISLLNSYNTERREAADENIKHSTRATDFITPKTSLSKTMRDETLALAKDNDQIRAFVNSGRLSKPTAHESSALNTFDNESFTASCAAPGNPAPDLPIGGDKWLLNLVGNEFKVIVFNPKKKPIGRAVGTNANSVAVETVDSAELPEHARRALQKRYDVAPDTTYLFRPDQHVAARWRSFEPVKISAAVERACGTC